MKEEAKEAGSKAATTTISFLGGLGAPLAFGLSFSMWHGFWYAVLAALGSWYYVFYHIFTYGFPLIRRY